MAIILKDGTTTEDVRLDRLVQFDERSRGFPVRTIIPVDEPRNWTWYKHGLLDQGREGACVGFSVTHSLSARPSARSGLDAGYARNKIYFRAQEIDPWPGGAYPGASPFYEGTSILAGAKAAQELGHFDEYRWCFGLDDLILAVSRKGPVVIGVNWYTGMMSTDAKGLLAVTGSVAGGHAIAVSGVSLRKKMFKLWNSWGSDWGVGGSCYLTFDDMNRLLHEDGEAVVFVNRRSKHLTNTVEPAIV